MIKLKLSICVVSYNQEKYVGECLRSLVEQATDFPFEIIVSDDCSSDGTRKIIGDYAARYPQIVKPIFQSQNVGALQNFLDAHAAAEGEYIAHIDGDDYSLPGKLQKQVDFLDNNPSVNILWHRMYVKNESSGVLVEDLLDLDMLGERFTRADILRFITIGANSSKMYRSSAREFELPSFPVVDYYANVEQVGTGFAAILPGQPLGVYRAGIGIASAGNLTKQILSMCFLHFARKYPQHRRDVSTAAFLLFLAALKNRRWADVSLFARTLFSIFTVRSLIDLYRFRRAFGAFRIPSTVRANEVK